MVILVNLYCSFASTVQTKLGCVNAQLAAVNLIEIRNLQAREAPALQHHLRSLTILRQVDKSFPSPPPTGAS